MPILTGQLALTGAAQQLTTTKTSVVTLYISNSTATAFAIGPSTVAATGPGILVPAATATTPISIGGPQAVFNLIELYVIGASGTLNWLAVTR